MFNTLNLNNIIIIIIKELIIKIQAYYKVYITIISSFLLPLNLILITLLIKSYYSWIEGVYLKGDYLTLYKCLRLLSV